MTESSPSVVDLRAGHLRLVLRPDLGASITGFWHGQLPVLRSAEPAAVAAPTTSGGYVLAPYSNRIGLGRFPWQGQVHQLRMNYEGSPHPLHGVAWRRPWQVLRQTDADVELRCAHGADGDWPFDFTLTQHLTLSPQALLLRLVFTNTDTRAQPVGLGWHPYFARRARSHLQAAVTERWENGADHLPLRKQPQADIDAAVDDLAFDHCFEGWRAPATLHDEQLQLRLSSSLPYLVVYTPAGRDFFCVEPVSHVNNAILSADPAAAGLRTLQSGQMFEVWVRLEVNTIE